MMIDFTRAYATVHGGGDSCRYEQDGKRFSGDGSQIYSEAEALAEAEATKVAQAAIDAAENKKNAEALAKEEAEEEGRRKASEAEVALQARTAAEKKKDTEVATPKRRGKRANNA